MFIRQQLSEDASPDLLTNSGPAISQNDLFLRQLVLEKRAVEISAEKYRELTKQEFQSGRGANLSCAQRLISQWFPAVISAVEGHMDGIRCGTSSPDRSVLGPFLLTLKPATVS